MPKNNEATEKHLENLSKVQNMLMTIQKFVEVEINSKKVRDGSCTWSDVGESSRVVADLTDLHDRITKQGEYA